MAPDRTPRSQGRDRKIYARLAVRVRELADQGASAADVAAALDLDPDRVHDFLRRLQPIRGKRLARPRCQAKQRRIDQPRPRRPRQPKEPKQPKPRIIDAWKLAALEDERYRDSVAPFEAPAAAIAAELVDQAVAVAEMVPEPRPSPLRVVPVAESWGSVHASGPRKITAEVLAEALRLREAGWSWPAIARKFGCHRQSLYFARKRTMREAGQ